jgi:hypothetical protein
MTVGQFFMLASVLLPLSLAGNHLDAGNLVYRSPYSNHDGLALDTHAIAKRHEHTTKRLRKRQISQLTRLPVEILTTTRSSSGPERNRPSRLRLISPSV